MVVYRPPVRPGRPRRAPWYDQERLQWSSLSVLVLTFAGLCAGVVLCFIDSHPLEGGVLAALAVLATILVWWLRP